MLRFLYLALIFITSCSTNKVVSNHGISFIDIKSKQLVENKSNKNDIIQILGPPSIKSEFDENIWIYIERKKTSTTVFTLGKRKIEKNNALIVQINDNGLLEEKTLINLDNMNDLKFSKKETKSNYTKDSYIYNVLTSLREKINSPTKRRVREE
tara:strand:- start:940 stop:1401 length:462 start_codon:yes stop_codon:yes gene_type:complete